MDKGRKVRHRVPVSIQVNPSAHLKVLLRKVFLNFSNAVGINVTIRLTVKIKGCHDKKYFGVVRQYNSVCMHRGPSYEKMLDAKRFTDQRERYCATSTFVK